jgi:hypothetical protein
MATITTILASDIIASSRVTLNTNFANLNTDKVDVNSTYADPAWITSLAGSKVTGNIGGNAATATALATARTIAGVSFNGTANIAIPSTGLSDSSDIVRGASSVASGQVLYGTAAGVAGSSANFRYFVGTGNMVVGTTTDDGTNRLQVAGSIAVGPSARITSASGTTASLTFAHTANGAWTQRIPGTGTALELLNDGGNRQWSLTQLGVSQLWNETPTTGVTQFIVRAGAGQSTTNLQTWQNASGSSRLLVTSSLGLVALGTFLSVQDSAGSINRAIIQSTMDVNSSYSFNFSSTTDAGGAKDLSLSRASANTLQVGDGGSNALGSLLFKGGTVYDSSGAGNTSFVVRNGAAQSSNLQVWANSGGTPIAYVDAGGNFFGTQVLELNNTARLTGSGVVVASNRSFGFSSTTGSGGALDAAFARNAAGVVEINNGTAGTLRDLYLRGVRPVGSTVANLPTASGNTGMMATVTDATVTTIGTTVAGGGGNTVLVWSNGTNWRIYAN